MSTKIFVNLPVADLEKSKLFFQKLGYQVNPQFTDNNAACMVLSDQIFVMLLVKDFFKQFITKEITDTSKSVESITAISADSKSEVDRIVEIALGSGGVQYSEPNQMPNMYSRNFTDPDGHLWEYFWMDPASINP